MKIYVPQINSKTLFRILFIGYFFSGGILALFFSILSLFNVIPIILNDKEYVGISGFLIGILYIPFIAIVCTLSTIPFIIFGLWIAKVLFGGKKGNVPE